MLLTMSTKEIHRLEVIINLIEKRITGSEAAYQINVSERQIRRLKCNYQEHGSKGLVTKKRGMESNNKMPQAIRELSIDLIKEKYSDFRPTFAAEKLAENHGICTLLVYIDDATSRLLELRFVKSESTFTYFESTRRYLEHHGKPVAFYSDKHSTFRTNKKGEMGGDGVTQFGRALTQLNIDIICANSSQAKGRVERANRTLQDRLVKELRLRKISTIKHANAYLPSFIEDFNVRFSKPPKNDRNLHRELQSHEDLTDIFCWQEPRTLSNSLTVQYDRVVYLIKDSVETRKLARKKVTVFDYPDGFIKIKYDNVELPYSVFDKLQKVDQAAVVNNKRLGSVLEFIQEKQEIRNEKRSSSSPSRQHLGEESTARTKRATVVKRKRTA